MVGCRYQALTRERDLLNSRWDEQNTLLVQSHERVIQDLTEEYEQKLQEEQVLLCILFHADVLLLYCFPLRSVSCVAAVSSLCPSCLPEMWWQNMGLLLFCYTSSSSSSFCVLVDHFCCCIFLLTVTVARLASCPLHTCQNNQCKSCRRSLTPAYPPIGGWYELHEGDLHWFWLS